MLIVHKRSVDKSQTQTVVKLDKLVNISINYFVV